MNHALSARRPAGSYVAQASAPAPGVDSQAYLRDVFERLPLIIPADESALEELRPSVWAAAFKARREHTSPPALKIA